MGCDIHLYVEKRVDGSWVSADTWEEDHGEKVVVRSKRFYEDRCYDLFAILADVRNGHGFAGIPTGEGFVPISQPKGLPDDVTPQVRECSDRFGVDGHSHSWFTLSELLSYDWTQGTVRFCVVNGPEFAEWNRWRRGRGLLPDSFCGEVSGPGVRKVAPGDLESLVIKALSNKEDLKSLGLTYARFGVRMPYYLLCGSFWSQTIPRLLALGKPEDVRIVFFFDN